MPWPVSGDVEIVVNQALEGQKRLTSEVHLGQLDQVNGKVFNSVDRADILFVDLDPANKPELDMLKRIASERHGRGGMIATVPEQASLAHIRQLVQAGVDDVIPHPVKMDDISEAIEVCHKHIASRTLGPGNSEGHVIGFMRGRGGAGASTLALNTALALLRKKRRKDPDKKVLLIDLDLQFGNDGLLLDIEPKDVMMEIIRHPERLDSALLRSAVSRHEKSGLDVLPAPVDPVPIEAMGPETIAQVIELARIDYDYVVLDMPPALTTWLEPVLSRLSKLYLVTQLNVVSIRHTRRLMDFLAEDLMGLPIGIVVNRHVNRLDFGAKVRQGAKALGRPVDHILPEDGSVAEECADSGTPIVLAKPRSKIGKAIVKLAESTVSELTKAKEKEKAGG